MTRPILVFGAGGRVAHTLAGLTGDWHRWVDSDGLERNAPIVSLTQREADVTDAHDLMRVIGVWRPQAIINLAAIALPIAEQPLSGNSAVNDISLWKIGTLASLEFCPVIHISTDCVFSGTNVMPYKEDAQTHPANRYGEAKLEGERRLAAACDGRHIIIRTTGVYLRDKPNFLKLVLDKARAGEALTVVEDSIYTPTDARELARAILVATERVIEAPSVSGTYHFAGPDVMSYLDFARLVQEGAGLSAPIEPTTMAEREKIEGFKRPKNAALNSDKFAEVFGLRHRPTRDCVRELVNPA